jgi:multiple sugar transport system permease protein
MIRKERRFGSGLEIALLALLAIVMLFPVVWMLETALKESKDIYAVPAKVITGWSPTLEHFKKVFSSDSPVLSGFKSSIIVAGFSTLIATLFGVPAAWAYSRFKIPGKKDQLFFILSTRFMPPVVVVIPIFLMFRNFGLLDTRLGLILVYSAFNLPFTIWMMKGFIDDVPAEYEEASMLDGYSRFESFWRVTLPLLIPGIAATAVFALIFSWNEFVFSIFLITTPETRTAPAAIAGLIGGTTTDWGLVAASAMTFAVPVLIFAFLVRKHLVAGVTLGAVRR